MSKAKELAAKLSAKKTESFAAAPGRRSRSAAERSKSGHVGVLNNYKTVGGGDLGPISNIEPEDVWWSDLHDRSIEHTSETDAFKELHDSIETLGQREAGRVRRNPNPDNPSQVYELISGLNRLLVAKRLGKRFKAHIINVDTYGLLTEKLAENTGRSDISLIERAHHFTKAWNLGEDGQRYVKEAAKVDERTMRFYRRFTSVPVEFFPNWVELNLIDRTTLIALSDYVLDDSGDLTVLSKKLELVTATMKPSSSSTKLYVKALQNLVKSLGGKDKAVKAKPVSLKKKIGKLNYSAVSSESMTTIKVSKSIDEESLKEILDGFIKTIEGK